MESQKKNNILTRCEGFLTAKLCFSLARQLSAAIFTDTSHATVKNSQLGQIIWEAGVFLERQISLQSLCSRVRKLNATVVDYPVKWRDSFPLLMQSKESYNHNFFDSLTAHFCKENKWAQNSYFLNSRMAMTKMTMSTTANTGPITHSISGCSITCGKLVTWIGSE